MRRHQKLVLLTTVFFATACYHATVETGLTPSTQTVEKGFAASWIGGLVPPSTVSTAAQCHNGVAKVETQLTFVNMLVGFITAGIFTPMSITATCAAAGAHAANDGAAPTLTVRQDAPQAVIQAVFAAAGAAAAAAPGQVALVQFTSR